MTRGAAMAMTTDATGAHAYLSTACFHANHEYRKSAQAVSDHGETWTKSPSQCKFCAARCQCPCHGDSRRESLSADPEPDLWQWDLETARARIAEAVALIAEQDGCEICPELADRLTRVLSGAHQAPPGDEGALRSPDGPRTHQEPRGGEMEPETESTEAEAQDGAQGEQDGTENDADETDDGAEVIA